MAAAFTGAAANTVEPALMDSSMRQSSGDSPSSELFLSRRLRLPLVDRETSAYVAVAEWHERQDSFTMTSVDSTNASSSSASDKASIRPRVANSEVASTLGMVPSGISMEVADTASSVSQVGPAAGVGSHFLLFTIAILCVLSLWWLKRRDQRLQLMREQTERLQQVAAAQGYTTPGERSQQKRTSVIKREAELHSAKETELQSKKEAEQTKELVAMAAMASSKTTVSVHDQTAQFDGVVHYAGGSAAGRRPSQTAMEAAAMDAVAASCGGLGLAEPPPAALGLQLPGVTGVGSSLSSSGFASTNLSASNARRSSEAASSTAGSRRNSLAMSAVGSKEQGGADSDRTFWTAVGDSEGDRDGAGSRRSSVDASALEAVSEATQARQQMLEATSSAPRAQQSLDDWYNDSGSDGDKSDGDGPGAAMSGRMSFGQTYNAADKRDRQSFAQSYESSSGVAASKGRSSFAQTYDAKGAASSFEQTYDAGEDKFGGADSIERAYDALSPKSKAAAIPEDSAVSTSPATEERRSSLMEKLEQRRVAVEEKDNTNSTNFNVQLGSKPRGQSLKGDMPGAEPAMAEKLRLRRQKLEEAERVKQDEIDASSPRTDPGGESMQRRVPRSEIANSSKLLQMELVKKYMAARQQNNVEGAMATLSPDAVLDITGRLHSGERAVRQYLSEQQPKVTEPSEPLESDDAVVVRFKVEKSAWLPWVPVKAVFTFVDGPLIASVKLAPDMF